MAEFKGFVGQSYTADSLLADAQSSVNWFVEGIQSGEGQNSAGYLRETPGIALAILLPTSPVRGVFANATRLFAVAGTDLYELFSQIGTATTSGTTVTWVSGAKFDNVNGVTGNTIWINGVQYTVASYTSATILVLTGSAGVQVVAVAYSAMTYVDRSVLFTLPLANDGLPVQFFVNGNQLLIVSAGLAYTDSGAGPVEDSINAPLTGTCQIDSDGLLPRVCTWVSGTLFNPTMVGQTITIGTHTYAVATYSGPTVIGLGSDAIDDVGPLPFSVTQALAAGTGTFLDGYFIVSQPGTAQFNYAVQGDGTTWDPLNYETKAGYPDALAAVFADHEELWLFGTDTTEVWQDTGAALNPFQRIPSAFIHHGLIAALSPVRLLNGVACLASDPVRGGVTAYLYQGFIPQRISTHAIETVWASYSTCADAVSFYYTEQGHEFCVITFPTGNATWVYDATEGAWHQRGWWNGASNDRQRQMFHAFVFGSHYVGDWSNGKVYIQSQGTFTDNGVQIVRQRAAPHLNTEHLWSFFNEFELLVDAAAAVTFTLDWSDSIDYTNPNAPVLVWHKGLTASPSGVTGQALRVIWRRLGRSRDRIFRVTVSAADKVAIVNAYLDVTN